MADGAAAADAADSRLLERLQRQLAYRFTRPELLDQALTHRSCDARQNNERLEFLGDAILGAVMADRLCGRFPAARESDLTLARSRLVRGSSLAAAARRLELGRCLRLGVGERASGGRDRASILADALEAVIGAVYLDGGYGAAAALIDAQFRDSLADDALIRTEKDAKTRLQEQLQALGEALPRYETVAETGAAHARRFTVACRVEARELQTEAVASSRRRAEQAAAAAMLERLDAAEAGDG